MSIARKSAVDAMSQAGIVVMSTIAGIFVSRRLGGDGRGAYVLATYIANALLMNFTSFGMRLSLQVFAARERERTAELHTLALLFSLIVGGMAGGGFLLLAPFIQQTILRGIPMIFLWAVSLTAPFTLYYVCWVGLMNGLGEIKRRALIEFSYGAFQSLSIIGILLFMRDKPITLLVFIYYGLLVVFALTMFTLFPERRWLTPRRDLVRQVFGYSKWVYAGNFAAQLRMQIDQLIVNYSGSAAVLGVYNQAASLASRALLPASALETSAYKPITASASAEAGRLVCASFRQMLLIGAAISAVGWLCAPLIPLIYGSDFADSIWPFRVLLLATCLIGAARMIVIYFSGHLADPRFPMIVNWITVGFQFLLTFYLIERAGVLVGVTWATAVTFFLTSLIFIIAFVLRKETPPAMELIRIRKDDFGVWSRILGRKGR